MCLDLGGEKRMGVHQVVVGLEVSLDRTRPNLAIIAGKLVIKRRRLEVQVRLGQRIG